MPDVDGVEEQGRQILRDLLQALARAAAALASDAGPQSIAEDVSRAAVRGVAQEFHEAWPELHGTVDVVLERLYDYLQRSSEDRAAHLGLLRDPAGRARVIAAAGLEGAVEQFHASFPRIAEDMERLAEPAGKIARHLAREFAEELRANTDDLARLSQCMAESAARGLVHGFAAHLEEELGARQVSGAALGASFASAAQRTTAAVVASGAEELRRQVGPALQRDDEAVVVATHCGRARQHAYLRLAQQGGVRRIEDRRAALLADP
ncbi:MAG: hypothetical protein ACK4N5_00560, partial [Myxococcales bacterium]